MTDKYTSDNLYIDEILNFDYLVNPDKEDDLDLYEYAKELKKSKFKQVLIPFKFNMGYEGDMDDYFVFSKEYDDETQINLQPYKKHYLYLTNLEKDYTLMVWKLHYGENYKTVAYDDFVNSSKLDIRVETMKLKKDNQPFDYRYVGIVSIGYDNPSPMNIILGCIRGFSCETLWTHFDRFLLNQSNLDEDIKDAYDKDLSKIDYEIEYMKRHDCVFPF